jgi:hypothetical protein
MTNNYEKFFEISFHHRSDGSGHIVLVMFRDSTDGRCVFYEEIMGRSRVEAFAKAVTFTKFELGGTQWPEVLHLTT